MTREALQEITLEKINQNIYDKVQQNWDALAKPLDSLGEFETTFAKIGAILSDETVPLEKKAVIVMCADNGIVEEGISQSGQEVTACVAQALGERKSSVCRMAKAVGADVIPVDIGIATTEQIKGVLEKKVAHGTRNFLKEPAMTEQETLTAIACGIEVVKECRDKGYTLLATGEMGIGNTTTSAAVAAALTGLSVEQVTGKGAGLSEDGLKHKIDVIKRGLKLHSCAGADAFSVLSAVGGLDIAGLCGVCIGAGLYHIPVVLDGVISVAAAFAAEQMVSGVKEYLIASHQSREPAAEFMMQKLGLNPVLYANLALGEGTGAVLMFSLLDTVGALYENKTTFSDIKVEQYTRF